jgi:ABC-type transport system involved in multi-copper enzyme maturation permease subunit
MLARITAIAHTTFREAARDRVPLGLFGAGLAAGLTSLLVAAMSLGRDRSEVVAVLTSASISLFSVVGAIVLGASSLYKDLERKTVYPILARPIHRHELVIGKHFGLVATVATFACLDGALALTLTALQREEHLAARALAPWLLVAVVGLVVLFRARDRSTPFLVLAPLLLVTEASSVGALGEMRRLILVSVGLSVVESALVAAVALVFGAFSSPFLTAALTTGVTLIGRNADLLAKLPEKTFGATFVAIGRGMSRVVPNLHIYVPPRVVVLGELSSTWSFVGQAALYGLLYVAMLLVLSSLIFRRRDFA